MKYGYLDGGGTVSLDIVKTNSLFTLIRIKRQGSSTHHKLSDIYVSECILKKVFVVIK